MVKGLLAYSDFNEIDDPSLRAWNRYQTASNIREEHGRIPAERYIEQFTKADKLAIYIVVHSIQRSGVEQVRRDIFRDLNERKVANEYDSSLETA